MPLLSMTQVVGISCNAGWMLMAYLRGERETERTGLLDTLRAGDPFPLRAGLTDRDCDLEADLQSTTSSLPSARLSCCLGTH